MERAAPSPRATAVLRRTWNWPAAVVTLVVLSLAITLKVLLFKYETRGYIIYRSWYERRIDSTEDSRH